jgi:drug/metabolite transporter (DMT)-like permease
MSANRPASTSSAFGAIDLAALVFLGAVWGGAFLFFRIASPEVGPVWAAEIRVAIAATVLIAFAGRSSLRQLRGRLRQVAIVGAIFSAIPFTLISIGALVLPASFGALLNAMTPMFTALVGVAWLGQRLSRKVVVGLGFGFAGVLVLVGWSPLTLDLATLVAVAATIGATVSYAFAGTFVKRFMGDVPGVALATGQLTSATLILLPIAILSGPPGTPSVGGTVSLLALGVLSTALAWPVFFRVLRRTGATAASTVTFVVPVFGMVWGSLALGEHIGPEFLAGFALVLVSLVLILGVTPARLAGTLPRVTENLRGLRTRDAAPAPAEAAA